MRHLFFRIFLPVLVAVLMAFAGGIAAAWLLMPQPKTDTRVMPGPGPGPDRGPPPAGGPPPDWGRGPPGDDFGPPPPPPEDEGRPPGPPWREPGERRPPPGVVPDGIFELRTQGDRVRWDLARGNVDKACERVNALNQRPGIVAVLLRDDGASLCGGPPTPALAALAREALTQRESMVSDSPTLLRVVRLLRASGATYVFAGEFDKSVPFRTQQLVYEASGLAAVVIALGVVSFLLARHIARPVLMLRGAVRRFADGDLEQRIGTALGKRRDELAELGRDFDRMAARIAALLTAQRRLLQDISHELRSPLTRQGVALELARRSVGPEAQGALERVGREAERMNALVDELLTLTRLESGAPTRADVVFSLDELLRDVLEDVAFEAQSTLRSVRLATCVACQVRGQPKLLRRALENVLRNAVRHTPAGSVVEVALERVGAEAAVRIRDQGPGVPEAELQSILRPFYRVSLGRERETGGTGLGLAIADRAVRSHGGSIVPENAPEGGLMVTIRVPISG